MKAIIFAAGLGTRLQSLTENKPKALVEVNKKALLAHTIDNLLSHGFNDIIINVHHFYQEIIDFVKTHYTQHNIHFSIEKDKVLETGGGLLHARDFFENETFLAFNTDILTDIDLSFLYKSHIKTDLCTLASMQRESNRRFLVDENNYLCGWENLATEEKIISRKVNKMQPASFCGIHIINPHIFELMDANKEVFSITKTYIELSKEHKIKLLDFSDTFWIDAGTPEAVFEAEEILKKQNQ